MFEVVASKNWRYTGVDITPDMKIIISYEKGKWNIGHPYPYSDADGYADLVLADRRFPAINSAALMGRVGNKELKVANYCEISGSQMTGRLALIINDHPSYYDDNLGRITVKICIQSSL